MPNAATEETQQTNENQVEQTEAQAEADLSAGFTKVHGEKTSPSPEAKTKTEVAPTAKAEDNPAGAASASNTVAEVKTVVPAAEDKTKATLIAGMTEDELRTQIGKGAAWESEVRRAFSKIGEINRTVQDLSKALSAGKSGRKITAETLKRVSEELPGLGEALAADLSAIFDGTEAATQEAQATAAAQGKSFDEQAFTEKLFAEKIGPALQQLKAQANEEAQTELLEFMHPNYAATLQAPEFAAWLKTLTAERQKEVVESPRAVVAGKAIAEFKEWHAKAQKAQERSKARLEGAITPKGGGAPPGQPTQDDEADFASGFKKGSKKA